MAHVLCAVDSADGVGPIKLEIKCMPKNLTRVFRDALIESKEYKIRSRRRRVECSSRADHCSKLHVLPTLAAKPVKKNYQDQDHQPRFVSKYSSKSTRHRAR